MKMKNYMLTDLLMLPKLHANRPTDVAQITC